MKQINQGNIYLVDLNPVKGSEQGGLRPVLVLQNNKLNQKLSTIVVAPLTANLKYKGFITCFFLPKTISKLPKDSLALLFQLRTIDKSRLMKEMGHLPGKDFRKLKMKLSYIFS